VGDKFEGTCVLVRGVEGLWSICAIYDGRIYFLDLMVKIKRYATMKSVLSENVRCLMQEDVFLSFDSEVRLEMLSPRSR